jgi:hypothetical protein
MSAHTPGPWYSYDNVPGASIGYRAIVDANGDTICVPSPMGGANARLIAAAPNLYEALELMLAMPEFDGTKETSEARRTAKWAARLALAAARPQPEEERT